MTAIDEVKRAAEAATPVAWRTKKHPDQIGHNLTDAGMVAADWARDGLPVEPLALLSRLETAEAERALAHAETGDLREGVTKAIGMPWITHPMGGGRCPDDKDIAEACAALKADRDRLSGQVKSLTETLGAVRAKFGASYNPDGSVHSVSIGNKREIVALLDTALSSTEAANG